MIVLSTSTPLPCSCGAIVIARARRLVDAGRPLCPRCIVERSLVDVDDLLAATADLEDRLGKIATATAEPLLDAAARIVAAARTVAADRIDRT